MKGGTTEYIYYRITGMAAFGLGSVGLWRLCSTIHKCPDVQ